MTPSYQDRLLQAWPLDAWRDMPVLVAVSGGPDSVALLRLLSAVRSSNSPPLRVAHFNHGWRGAESVADARFVQQLAGDLHCECVLGGPPAGDADSTSEDRARQARYAFLRTTAERLGARYIATGHTRNDQAETVLHRILRGSGLSGLAGIPPRRVLSPAVTVVRPLLGFGREEILCYLRSEGQAFRQDASNTDTQWTRNRIRHDLLPLLESDYNANVADALLRLSHIASSANAYIEDQVVASLQRCERTPVERMSGGRNGLVEQVDLDCRVLRAMHAFLRSEIFLYIWRRQNWPLQAMGHAQWQRLDALLHADSDTTHFPGNICAASDGRQLHIAPAGNSTK